MYLGLTPTGTGDFMKKALSATCRTFYIKSAVIEKKRGIVHQTGV